MLNKCVNIISFQTVKKKISFAYGNYKLYLGLKCVGHDWGEFEQVKFIENKMGVERESHESYL